MILWMEFGPVETFASDFHHCRKTGREAHKFSAWQSGGTWGSCLKTEGWDVKGLPSGYCFSVLESVFHSGHFYRAIQSQNVRQIRGVGGGCSVRNLIGLLSPACCFSMCAPAALQVTGCKGSQNGLGCLSVHLSRAHTFAPPLTE